MTRQVLEAAKGRLKVVGRAGVGVDNVDLTAATEVMLMHVTVITSPIDGSTQRTLGPYALLYDGNIIEYESMVLRAQQP